MSLVTINSLDVASKTLERVFKRKAEALAESIAKEATAKLKQGLMELAAEAAIEVVGMFQPDGDRHTINLVFKDRP
jgi:lauroyl/myristoyl acyltransferase